MCVLAAYTGTEPAAPILLEMIRRIQGLGGGYSTGIATVAGGTLHWEKVVGDVDHLVATTPAVALTGTTGIAHSRSKGIGDREWAHPFVDHTGRLAYVVNGDTALLGTTPDFAAAAQDLWKAGHRFRTLDPPVGERARELPAGFTANSSELTCHQIARRFAQTGDLAAAMEAAFCDLPHEIAGLCCHADRPGQIAAARINMPLWAARDHHGWYAASSSLAFPVSASDGLAVPPCSRVTLSPDGPELVPFAAPLGPVAPLPSRETIRQALGPLLSDGRPHSFAELGESTSDLWPEGAMAQKGMALFGYLQALVATGRAVLQDVCVPGQEAGLTAPRTMVTWGPG